MCGISGVVLKPNEAVDRSVLERMSSAMSRRGPDAQGVFAHQHFGFAHQRLKVIDLSNAANQPMISQSQKVILVFNGEVYNYRELRNDLERNHSRKFITESDTEVILQAYEVFGTDAFAKFNGMFALSILDLRESEPVLYLVRDHFGIKPLFYSDHSERLAFASELKPLLKLDWIGKRLDQDALFSYLKFSHVPCPLSIFKDVKQLEPGTFLAFRVRLLLILTPNKSPTPQKPKKRQRENG
jgi:asparagine synthase (glutamine-hydrolysing)